MRIPLSWLREYAQVPADATAEDVLADLGVRQAMRQMPKGARL